MNSFNNIKAKTKFYYNDLYRCKKNLSLLENLKQKARIRVLKEFTKKIRGNILVVGCGVHNEMIIFNDKAEVIGIDISKVAIEKQKKRFPQFHFLVADAQSLPFNNNSFDCILCSEVIEHLSKRKKFLKEAYRILRPRGYLILTTPNWLSFYGLARFIGEKITKKPMTAGNQLIDNWTTLKKLEKEIENKNFLVTRKRGIWYFPPTGKGQIKLSDYLVLPIIIFFYPLEILFEKYFPSFGHMMAIECVNQKEKSDD